MLYALHIPIIIIIGQNHQLSFNFFWGNFSFLFNLYINRIILPIYIVIIIIDRKNLGQKKIP